MCLERKRAKHRVFEDITDATNVLEDESDLEEEGFSDDTFFGSSEDEEDDEEIQAIEEDEEI